MHWLNLICSFENKLKMKSCSRTYNNTYSISIYIPRTLCTEDRWWYIIYLFFCFYSLYEFSLNVCRSFVWINAKWPKSCKGKCCYLNIYVTHIRYGFGYIMGGKPPIENACTFITYIHIFFFPFYFEYSVVQVFVPNYMNINKRWGK